MVEKPLRGFASVLLTGGFTTGCTLPTLRGLLYRNKSGKKYKTIYSCPYFLPWLKRPASCSKGTTRLANMRRPVFCSL